jgi:hypothetical protein
MAERVVGNGSFGVVFQVKLFISITRLQYTCLWWVDFLSQKEAVGCF